MRYEVEGELSVGFISRVPGGNSSPCEMSSRDWTADVVGRREEVGGGVKADV